MALFRKLPDAEALDRLLAVAQDRGATRVRWGDFEVELDPHLRSRGSETLATAARMAARPALTATEAAGDPQPTDDELLYGVDGFGLGAPKGASQ
jgi:hypothetical protein